MCSPQETFEDGPTSDLLDEYFFLSQQLISIIGEQVLLYLAHKYVKLTLNPIWNFFLATNISIEKSGENLIFIDEF